MAHLKNAFIENIFFFNFECLPVTHFSVSWWYQNNCCCNVLNKEILYAYLLFVFYMVSNQMSHGNLEISWYCRNELTCLGLKTIFNTALGKLVWGLYKHFNALLQSLWIVIYLHYLTKCYTTCNDFSSTPHTDGKGSSLTCKYSSPLVPVLCPGDAASFEICLVNQVL